ncbi:hypothetical protein DBB42_26565 [Pseudomonas plecoglossicida]|uniref:Uncharacterized protein n=1 Tax=Pseudomonas plecoglossicida TaxID=70775 RepID=A0A2R7UBZ5_PSEDL|nr:hypothetical protein DBB42_26565 [Pseudomonas plecoglossicida]
MIALEADVVKITQIVYFDFWPYFCFPYYSEGDLSVSECLFQYYAAMLPGWALLRTCIFYFKQDCGAIQAASEKVRCVRNTFISQLYDERLAAVGINVGSTFQVKTEIRF